MKTARIIMASLLVGCAALFWGCGLVDRTTDTVVTGATPAPTPTPTPFTLTLEQAAVSAGTKTALTTFTHPWAGQRTTSGSVSSLDLGLSEWSQIYQTLHGLQIFPSTPDSVSSLSGILIWAPLVGAIGSQHF